MHLLSNLLELRCRFRLTSLFSLLLLRSCIATVTEQNQKHKSLQGFEHIECFSFI